MKYCKRIVDGEINENNINERYEEQIKDMCNIAGVLYEINRIQMANEIYKAFSVMEYNEELKDALK